MEEREQQGQKTVVAFITGLLIGGLLVWVFSAAPDKAPTTDDTRDDASSETNVSDTRDENAGTDENEGPDTVDSNTPSVSTNGTGALRIGNQDAGNQVAIESVTYPRTDGWLVVRDGKTIDEGRILGAARFSTSAGLLPKSIELIRPTEAGKEYMVVFYSENGDRLFDTDDDTAIKNADGSAIMATFKAN